MNEYRPLGFRLLPPVVKNLLIINILLYIATFTLENSLRIDISEYLALFNIKSQYFLPFQFITHMFLHGSFQHLFFNMFALWMFGNVIENLWGAKRFLLFYFVCGIGAAVLLSLINWISISSIENAFTAYKNTPSPDAFLSLVNEYFPQYKVNSAAIAEWRLDITNPEYINETNKLIHDAIIAKTNVPTVGASGAVFGLLLAFGMMFPNSLLYVYFFFPIKAKYFVIIYGAIELYAGVMNEPGDNIAHFAHLGGMLFGLILILYWRKKGAQRYN